MNERLFLVLLLTTGCPDSAEQAVGDAGTNTDGEPDPECAGEPVELYQASPLPYRIAATAEEVILTYSWDATVRAVSRSSGELRLQQVIESLPNDLLIVGRDLYAAVFGGDSKPPIIRLSLDTGEWRRICQGYYSSESIATDGERLYYVAYPQNGTLASCDFDGQETTSHATEVWDAQLSGDSLAVNSDYVFLSSSTRVRAFPKSQGTPAHSFPDHIGLALGNDDYRIYASTLEADRDRLYTLIVDVSGDPDPESGKYPLGLATIKIDANEAQLLLAPDRTVTDFAISELGVVILREETGRISLLRDGQETELVAEGARIPAMTVAGDDLFWVAETGEDQGILKSRCLP